MLVEDSRCRLLAEARTRARVAGCSSEFTLPDHKIAGEECTASYRTRATSRHLVQS